MDGRKLAAIVAVACVIKKRRRRYRTWVKEWVKQRENLGFYKTLLPELKTGDPKLYKNFLRMSSEDFDMLLENVSPIIKKEDTVMRNSISPGERLAVTLRFLATGDSYHSLMYLFRIPVQTISKIIPECCQAIYDCLLDYLKVPTTRSDWNGIASDFENRWNFPNCIGALDGKHIVLQKPKNSGSVYYNYKGSFSIVLMAMVDANYRFIYVDVGCNGRVSDGGVFQNCSLSQALETNALNLPEPKPLPGRDKAIPFVVVADDAFPMKSNIMKPYPYRNQPGPNRVYNYRLSRARRIVENAFGLIVNRYRILRNTILLEPPKVRTIICAIVALHNFLLTRNSQQIYAPPGIFDREIDGGIINGTWREENIPDNVFFRLEPPIGHNISHDCKQIREEFKDYFVSPEGEVPWQYKCI